MKESAYGLNSGTRRNRYLMKRICTIRISLKLLFAGKTYTESCFISDTPLALTSLSCRELKRKRNVLKERTASWFNNLK